MMQLPHAFNTFNVFRLLNGHIQENFTELWRKLLRNLHFSPNFYGLSMKRERMPEVINTRPFSLVVQDVLLLIVILRLFLARKESFQVISQ
jgi:hypothetical protein